MSNTESVQSRFHSVKNLTLRRSGQGLAQAVWAALPLGYIWSPAADDMDLVFVVLIIVKVSQNWFVELPVRDSDSDFT